MQKLVRIAFDDNIIDITDLTPFPFLLCEFLYEGDFELMKQDLKSNSKFIQEANKIEELIKFLPALTSNFVVSPFILSEFLSYLEEFKISFSDLAHISLNGIFDTVLLECENRNYKVAEDLIDFILKIDPGFAPAYELMGSIYIEKGNLEEGKLYLENALKIDPWNVAALSELGQLYFNQGNFEKAAEMWKKELELSPNNYVTYFMITNAYIQNQDYTKAAKILEKFLNRFPKSILGKYQLSSIYKCLGRFIEAEGLQEDILRSTPEYSSDIEVWVKIMFENGKYQDVQTFLEKFISENPQSEHFKLLLIVPYIKSGNLNKAKEIYIQMQEKYKWYLYGLKEMLKVNFTPDEIKNIEKVLQ